MRETIYRLGHLKQGGSCQSVLFFIKYYVIQAIFGLPLLIVEKLGDGKISKQSIGEILKLLRVEGIDSASILYLISLLLLSVIIVQFLSYIYITSKSDFGQNFIQVAYKFDILFQSFAIGFLILATGILVKGIQLAVPGLLGVNIIIIFYILIWKLISPFYNSSFSLKRTSIFARTYSHSVLIQGIVKSIITIYLVTRPVSSSIEQTSITIIYTLLILYRLKSIVFNYEYHCKIAWSINCFYITFQFSIGIIIFLSSVTQSPLIYQNVIVLICLLTLFFFKAISSYRSYEQKQLIFLEVKDIKSQQKILIFLNILYGFSLPSKTDNEILVLVSLLKAHSIKCFRKNCYCKSKEIVPSNLSKQQVTAFLQQKIEEIQIEYSKSIRILIVCGFFRLIAFKNYPRLVCFLKRTRLNKNAFLLDFGLSCLEKTVKQIIAQNNKEGQFIKICLIFKLQQIVADLNAYTKQTILIKAKKNQYLCKKLCRVSQLQAFCDKQLQLMRKICNTYDQNISLFKRSKQFNSTCCFYFDKVFMLKPKLTEIQNNFIDNKLKSNQIVDQLSLKKAFFNKSACLFGSNLSIKEVGKICRVSQNITSMFGYQKNDIVNSKIESILPCQFRSQHEKLVEQWLNTGSSSVLGKIKQSFIVTKSNNISQVIVYLKVIPYAQNITLMTLVYKKNDEDFILFGSNYQIAIMGQKIQQILGKGVLKVSGSSVFDNMTKIIDSATNQPKTIQTKMNVFKKLQPTDDKFCQQKNNGEIQKQIYNNQQIQIVDIRVKYYFYEFSKQRILVFEVQQLNSNFFDRQQINGSFFSLGAYSGQEHKNEQVFEDKAGSSLASNCQKQNFGLNKMISDSLSIFFSPKQLNDARLNSLTKIIFLILVLLVSIIIGLFWLNNKGLTSISQLLFANGAVSDNMQLSQFLYNNLMMFKQTKQMHANSQEIMSSFKSTAAIQEYLYSLITLEHHYLFRNVTSLGSYPFYQYLKEQQTWKFTNASRDAKIKTNQFIEYFYYNSLTGLNFDEKTESALLSFQKNFPEMKRINHLNIVKYQNVIFQNAKILQYAMYAGIFVFFGISLILGIIVYRFMKHRHDQITNFFESHKLVNNSYFQTIANYYDCLIQYLSFLDIYMIQQKGLQLQLQRNTQISTSKLQIIKNKKFSAIIYGIIIIVLLLNAVNVATNIKVRTITNLSKDMTVSVNSLIDSENYLIEAYFQLKAYFIVSNQTMQLLPFIDSLMIYVRRDEVLFNQIAADSISLFSGHDQKYQSDFINILVNDICQIIEGQMTDFEVQKCKSQLSLNIIQTGVVSGMNFFQRQLMSALFHLKNQALSQNLTKAFLYQEQYQQIDKSMIYMFKIYQATQQRILISFNHLISQYLQFSTVLSVFQCIILFSLVFFYILMIPLMKMQLATIYGYLLTFPYKVLKENKNIIYFAQKNLEIRN